MEKSKSLSTAVNTFRAAQTMSNKLNKPLTHLEEYLGKALEDAMSEVAENLYKSDQAFYAKLRKVKESQA